MTGDTQLHSLFDLPDDEVFNKMLEGYEAKSSGVVNTGTGVSNPSSEMSSVYEVVGLADDAKQFDDDMEQLATEAHDAYESLLDLAQNSEPKFCAELSEVANKFLNTAMTAKIAKEKRKLDLLNMKMKLEKHEQTKAKQPVESNDDNGEIVIIRNRSKALDISPK